MGLIQREVLKYLQPLFQNFLVLFKELIVAFTLYFFQFTISRLSIFFLSHLNIISLLFLYSFFTCLGQSLEFF